MRYSLKEVFAQVTNPVGRRELLVRQGRSLWPLLRRLAEGYRRICLPSTVMVAVVGSLGKSTTMRAVTAALGLPVPNVPPGNSWSMLAFSLLTIRPLARQGVLEAGVSSVGLMEQYGRMIRPDITVVTTIASEHHRSLGTLAGIRSEKAAMVRCLPADGLAILNGDDPHVRWMSGVTRAPVVTYGFDSGNDIRAAEVECRWPEGNRITFRIGDRTHTIDSRLYGRYMVYPILAGVAAGMAVGRDMGRVLAALAGLEPTPGRMEIVRLDHGAWVLNDSYKGTIESVFSSLEVLGGIPAGRRIAVLGEVEDAPGSLGVVYRQVGMLSAECADAAIAVCSTNSAKFLRSGAAGSQVAGAAVIHAGRGWHDAYRLLGGEVRSGDVVLLKGRRTQRLERLLLALQGAEVGCRLAACKCSVRTCRACPMLKTGWKGRPVTV